MFLARSLYVTYNSNTVPQWHANCARLSFRAPFRSLGPGPSWGTECNHVGDDASSSTRATELDANHGCGVFGIDGSRNVYLDSARLHISSAE